MILNGLLGFLNLGTGEILFIILILFFCVQFLLSIFRRKK